MKKRVNSGKKPTFLNDLAEKIKAGIPEKPSKHTASKQTFRLKKWSVKTFVIFLYH